MRPRGEVTLWLVAGLVVVLVGAAGVRHKGTTAQELADAEARYCAAVNPHTRADALECNK